MANISKFDREDVLERAKDLFWQKGFLATSTREIQTAMDMRPGSIYAAFGSKADLYQASLMRYAQAGEQNLNNMLEQHDRAWVGLTHYLRGLIKPCCEGSPSELCMLVRTLSELDESHPDTLNVARELLSKFEQRFASIIDQAKLEGDLPAHLDSQLTAKKIQINIIGLRSYLKATDDVDMVRQQQEEFFTQLASV